LVHGDLKAANILVRRKRLGLAITLIDFGLSDVAGRAAVPHPDGAVLGSAHCMAPEQIRGETIDFKTDIYAFGVLLHRAFAGSYPHHGRSKAATLASHLHAEPAPLALARPDLGPQVSSLVARCLAKSADSRPTMEQVLQQLREERASRLRPIRIGLALFTGLVALLGLAWGLA
jgi:serine/threonine-protein kinase